MERFGFTYPDLIERPETFDHIVLCDVSKLADLGPLLNPQKVIEIIDHREINDAAKFSNARVQIEMIGAAATLVAERFKNANRTPSKIAATLLYGGIISNSGNFQALNTNPRDHAMATWLSNIAGLPKTFAGEMLVAKSDLSGSRLSEVLRGDSKSFSFGGKRICVGQIEMVGADDLILARKKEILSELRAIQNELRCDFCFLTITDLAKRSNILISDHEPTQALLHAVLGVEFKNNEARTGTILMRKQIMPQLKAYLES